MVQGKYLSSLDDISNVYYIRNSVFIDELNYEKSYINEEIDELSVHAVAIIDDNIVAATGRITLILNEDNTSSFSSALLPYYHNIENKV